MAKKKTKKAAKKKLTRNGEPCIKCGEWATHKSGYCAACRSVKCIVCGRVVVRMDYRRIELRPKCAQCDKYRSVEARAAV